MIKTFSGEHRWLSNFYESPLSVMGIPFLNSEAAYQACKTTDLQERKTFSSLTAGASKRLGRKVSLRVGWDDILKVECMELCLRAKFLNPTLSAKLIQTKNEKLIEGNTWGDTYWGVSEGKGENVLGRLLMSLRRDLQRNLNTGKVTNA